MDGVDPQPGAPNYQYDGAGRLTWAKVRQSGAPNTREYTYNFAPTGGCGLNAAAGKNTNRTSIVDAGTTSTFCYDFADRLTSTTRPGVGTISYDTHGNMTELYGETHAYDVADRHLATTKGATSVTYIRDATDRIVERKLNGTSKGKFAFTGGGDSPTLELNSNGSIYQVLISLPGGVLLSARTNANIWSYPNLHGDVVARANQSGTKQGATVTYSPDGVRIGTAAQPENAGGTGVNIDYGWLGGPQRSTEWEAGLQPVIEMGARQYVADLGRFIDPNLMRIASVQVGQ